MLPLVSINIPVFKCEDYIIRCLDSVKNQTYSNLEIILVNDCTPDNSIALIENFIKENPELNIQLIHHSENQGLSVVRNTGIDISQGKYLYFLDSDDEITKNCIELLVKEAEEKNVQIVIAQNRWINTFDNTIKDFGFPTLSKKIHYHDNFEIFQDYCLGLFPVISWNKLFLLEFIKENEIYFIKKLYAQDELWFFHIMLKAESLSIVNEITYLYYLHKDSVIFNRTKVNFENYQTILNYFHLAYNQSNQNIKKLLKTRIIEFREMVMIMQWKAMRGDVVYFKENYHRMKKLPKLNFNDFLSSDFSWKTKKLSILQNLPTPIGVQIFIKRFGN